MKRLRELRIAAGLTQDQLAHKAGLTVSGVQKIEQGKNDPKASTLEALADALGVEVGDLFPPVDEAVSA